MLKQHGTHGLENMKEQQLIEILEGVLGGATMTRDGDEALFHCPSCKHHKKKLSINLPTQKFQCWVCGFKGHKAYRILKKTNASPTHFSRLHDLNKSYNFKKKKIYVKEDSLQLPQEFKPLYPTTNDNFHLLAVKYLTEVRGLTQLDCIKYNIGYCDSGLYKNMIIFPSYNSEGDLNYFVGRSFLADSYIKHRQPKGANKDIIGLEFYINWNLPIILCESPLDAISIKRNAIPLYGKKIHDSLMSKLISPSVKQIYLALDADAMKNALEYAEKLIGFGKEVFILDFGDKDPNDTEFVDIINILHSSKQLTYSNIIKRKLSLVR
mgnify:FL=1